MISLMKIMITTISAIAHATTAAITYSIITITSNAGLEKLKLYS